MKLKWFLSVTEAGVVRGTNVGAGSLALVIVVGWCVVGQCGVSVRVESMVVVAHVVAWY